jgi:predicted ATPase
LYQDDFMAGFTLRDSPNFDEWQFFQTESLRRELLNVLERLVDIHSSLGEFEPAINYARRWLALDPLHEPAHRYLMKLYTWVDQRSAALRQYRECIRILEQELGVSPLDETTQLYQAIKENREPPPPVEQKDEAPGLEVEGLQKMVHPPISQPLPSLPRLPGNYPLVGRSSEWTVLLEAYQASSNGHLIVLEGEAGIGKTRLAEEFLAHVQAQGGATITARCYEGETNLAYGPFIEGLRPALAEPGCLGRLAELPVHWLSESARLLPELGYLRQDLPAAQPLDSPGAQSRFFEGLNQVILKVVNGPLPGLLYFDDLHWADEASLDLITYLVRRLHKRPLAVLVTWRSEQIPAGHRLRHLVSEAQRASKVTSISLSRLSQTDVKELIQSTIAAGDLPKGLAERLYRETEGLPFFLMEYLMGVAAGHNGDWLMPGSVRDLLHSRLEGVTETGWQLLTTAAVIGRSFGFDILREISGRSEEEAVLALEGLITQGLISEKKSSFSEKPDFYVPDEQEGARGPIYDFSHEKLCALVYEETSLARRRLLHRRVAEALISRTRGRSEIGNVAGQVAHHFRLAGQEIQAAEYFKLAGDHARRLYANVEAMAHFRSALALGYPDTTALHEAMGDLQTLLGEYGAALISYETAAALAPATGLGRLEHKLGEVHHRQGEWELAESHFKAALEALNEESDAGSRARVYADWSRTAHQQGRSDQASKLAHQALELAEVAADKYALAQAHNISGILASSSGELEHARYHLQQSLALAEQLADPTAQVAALNNLALVYSASGEIEQALTLTKTALTICTTHGDRHREAALHSNLADLLYRSGQAEDAMAHLKQSVTIFAEIGTETDIPRPEIWKLMAW